MYRLRRSVLLYMVFMLGMMLGHLDSRLMAIVGIPILLILLIQWDEVSFKREGVRNGRS